MFKKHLISFCCIFLALTGCLSFFFVRVGKNDLQSYEGLMALNQLSKDDQASLFSRHAGEEIVKEIWAGGLHTCIRSPESQISISKQNHQIRIVEHLANVLCLMQEELYYVLPDGKEVIKKENGMLSPRKVDLENAVILNAEDMIPMQRVRCIEAMEACYDYNNQEFTAKNVTLKTYELKGHSLPSEMHEDLAPVMEGVAQDIAITRKNNAAFDFRANKFKMTFDAKKGFKKNAIDPGYLP